MKTLEVVDVNGKQLGGQFLANQKIAEIVQRDFSLTTPCTIKKATIKVGEEYKAHIYDWRVQVIGFSTKRNEKPIKALNLSNGRTQYYYEWQHGRI